MYSPGLFLYFFNDPATTEIYTLSLHDALPISPPPSRTRFATRCTRWRASSIRSEEHTSELQSRRELVCRLLLEKKKSNQKRSTNVGPRFTTGIYITSNVRLSIVDAINSLIHFR